jgi:hypothetical protein
VVAAVLGGVGVPHRKEREKRGGGMRERKMGWWLGFVGREDKEEGEQVSCGCARCDVDGRKSSTPPACSLSRKDDKERMREGVRIHRWAGPSWAWRGRATAAREKGRGGKEEWAAGVVKEKRPGGEEERAERGFRVCYF